MKQPTIVYEGKEYPVMHISFYRDGELSSVTFFMGEELVTAFNKKFPWETEMINDGMVHLHLYKCLKLQPEGETV